MSEEELDNFRSMRGKSGHTTKDLSQHMSDDAWDLTDRLRDVKACRELEKKLSDTTGQPYTILITAKDVRLMHVDEKGHYHFNHFNAEKTRVHPQKDQCTTSQSWTVIDDEETNHIFVTASPSWVTVYHQNGVWQCRRVKGRIYEVEDSDRRRPIPKRIPRPGGKKHREARVWRLYSDEAPSDRSSNATPPPAVQICANTPGEKGQHHRAYQKDYHDY